jgi:uncharacterized protein (DUF1778 family)/DNA-binding XRE family transcriptional regulator
VEQPDLGVAIRERRDALGLSQARLARLSCLSRRTLARLEAGALGGQGFSRVAQLLWVPGLDLDPPSQAARSRKRGLWMAAKNASVGYVQQVLPDTPGHALASASLTKGYEDHPTHLLDEAPVPPVVMAVEEAATNAGMAPKAVWRNVAKPARSLAVHGQSLGAQWIRRGARIPPCVDNRYTTGQNSCIRCLYRQALEGHPMRDAAINLRAKPEQRDLIDQAAAMLGKNRSDFMLEAACDRAQSVLIDQVCFRLDDRRFKDFIRQLDAPPAASQGLERLMAVKAPWAEPGGKKASR